MNILTTRVRGRVKFLHYSQGELWYKTDDDFDFPVPIADTGNGVFLAEDKAIFFMRYIRAHMEMIDQAKRENARVVNSDAQLHRGP